MELVEDPLPHGRKAIAINVMDGGSNTWVNGISLEPGTEVGRRATFCGKIKPIQQFGRLSAPDRSAPDSGKRTAMSNDGSGVQKNLVWEIGRIL